MQWKITFCAVTFEEMCDDIFQEVALHCIELEMMCTVFRILHAQ